MMQLLRSLLEGKSSRAYPAKKPVPKTRPESARAGGDYRAVSIAPGAHCHAVAKDTAGKRYLLREAPRLPLGDCTMGANCSCKFRKHEDRRDGDRRLFGESENQRWF